ncbi:Ligand-dependent nuclear receptor corepressor-like protein [Larimichthys crocea]|uniref:Ligand-dependent nuclear receptor corepressor-like protein n=2 Tax=Larimichthys crocea TaxID=215358 RepID=A0A6G0HNM0_LARCR|nr:Ligand-dependent nuclear receptor corepressor-like protein [Larimichthys crocea]TMS04660.1 Ligand-dependent nuclear receptor corepressor-like protein [Larimichthys crocea]
MASQCKRQQCTIDRHGFRQELDSWRHKLIHCVGVESILEGLFGPELVEDLKLFKDLEPTTVSDWSFDENCLFCCLRRDKVKEHLIGLSSEGLEDTPKPLLVKDQTTISRLEKQAEEFLNAVLCRKDVPNFSDPHIPVVAREILQRMIRQFAAEYTSKTSSPQDSCSDSQPHSDQSLPTTPLLSGAPPSTSPATTVAGPAHNQNPVLSKLLMADQDAPLDLTIKKPLAVPSDQDGVLDLSIKKNRYSSSSLPVRSPCLSPATSTLKGVSESPDLGVTKAKDLQSTATLEQFMAKLCPHHQRQIVDAIGFLQTEVKALASSNTQQDSNSTSGIQGTACSTAKSSAVTPEKPCSGLRLPCESTPKLEVQDISHFIPSSCAIKKDDPALDLCSPESGSNQALVTTTANPVDTENIRPGEHVPLRMKIMTSSVAAGKKLSCVLSSHADTLEDREGNSNSSNRTETHSARLSSSVKRHNPTSHTHQARQKEIFGQAKETPAKLFSVHMTIPSDSPRTARKTIRASSDHRIRDTACRGLVDPDLGHCDIVFIDKPITECFKEQQRSMVPRRNARKSTRGHMYSDEIWELKTVRTLARRGNCPNPMPELITLVTPKQVLSKLEGVPPVDMPFAGSCRESISQQMSTEESDESVIPGTGDMVEVAASEVDVIVETSQTDQCQSKGQSFPPSPISSPSENKETDIKTDVEQNTTADSGMTTGSEESVAQTPLEEEKDNDLESQEDMCESTEQMVAETIAEPLENTTEEETEPQFSSDEQLNSDLILEQNIAPSPVNQVEEEKEENKREEIQHNQPQELQPETRIHFDSSEVTESNTRGSEEEPVLKEPEIKISEAVEPLGPLGTEDENDNCDVSSKTLDALLKELPPWRRKKGTVIPLPKRLRPTETVVVGYVNGRPISASDRSLRRRSSNSATSPNKTPVKSSQNVPNETSPNSAIDSNVKREHLDKPETRMPVESLETSPVVQQVKEPSSDTPSSPMSKCSPSAKQMQKQKRAQRDQDSSPVLSDQLESKRLLRSAGQRPSGAPVSPLTSNSVTSISSPKLSATNALPSSEHLHPPSPPSLLPVTSPSVTSSPPAVSEQSQQDTVPETTVELNNEKAEPVETTAEEIPKNKGEDEFQVKPKLRSAKAVVEDSNNEKPQLSSEVSSPLKNQSPVKTEIQTQITPLKSTQILQKEAEATDVATDVALPQKPDVACLGDKTGGGDDSSSSISEKPTRMPLRSESSKPEMSHQSVTQSPPLDNKKLSLRSQRFTSPSTSALTAAGRPSDLASPIRIMPERITKTQVKSPPVSVASVLPHSSALPTVSPRPEPPKQTNKFFEILTGEENQHLITNLNLKYDKMQKGWVQMDKEGQPATKYKNKADRQAAIWKSKRRARKTKSLDHQKYSPVQMLFMKSFNLTSICHWFLESTETKSLVIVKKVNTRLPSETQLCFHSQSSASGSSQGVFPSLQAERLKKHLKKFAIASPVKSNPKSQKLIAKALEQEANSVKGKERKELPNTTQTMTKSHSSKARVQIGESQKSSGKSKNPASARILRKYSNIREKMQVQQTNVRLKKASKTLRTNNMKRLATTKSAAKSNLKPSLKAQKSPLHVGKRIKESAAKMEKRKTLAGKRTTKHPVQERAVRAQGSSRAQRDATKKEELPKRCSQRLGSPKKSEHKPFDVSKSKADNKKQTEAEKVEVDKPAVSKANAAKIQTKESSQTTVTEIKGTENAVETSQQSIDVKVPTSPDQVLTRSQRKMEAAVPLSGSPSHVSKRATKSMKTQNASPKLVRKAEEPALTRSGALKVPAKRSQAAFLPSRATKSATKRARELLETPAKRTRTSLSK